MAKIEQEFLAARGTPGDHQAAPFLPRKPIPDIGSGRIDGERFHSRDFMAREWDMIWTKTWNIGCHESELPDPGSFRVHTLGKESLLFVRGEDGVVRGFFNVCQHRGNLLCQTDRGDVAIFKCPFHGWEWNIDGSLRRVMHPQLFTQFRNGVPADELALPPLKVDRWGGWIWFNMDPAAMPLIDYLGEAGRHLETYELDRFTFVDHKTFEWQGNWKHAHDAFNESYHFEALHPEFLNFAEGFDVPIELLGIHSRMLNFNHTVSEILDDRETVTPFRARMLGLPEDYAGSAKDAHLDVVARKRAMQDDTYLPYRRMNDEQLVHQYHYTFFPGTTITSTPEYSIVFRYRPHESDPGYCYYDFLITRHDPPGSPVPDVDHQLYRHDELPDYADAFAGTFDPVLANVLQQDGTNMPTMQKGTASRGFRGMILGDQEVRLRHFHQTIDRYLMGDAPRSGDR
ncbi:aromatic ring-hydroxylating oxygenase subunit alpha [Sphingomonas oryzagri]|uniref:Aromatic ring-hydroxylating dioxygenase subunit alpha n=1 Tax=Sphingomonas oryzagri TaxID=3042314 RepID=A0ABT6MZ01_9SPHN|nr:aromatic ring-hydroxylating dioxygenase subunit alpha [Sphingomonas oryzagri]MDH7637341.1 aromatic ring-hydroxylating dioxygenase subunit alpha [Sphingomonas oryzagri]